MRFAILDPVNAKHTSIEADSLEEARDFVLLRRGMHINDVKEGMPLVGGGRAWLNSDRSVCFTVVPLATENPQHKGRKVVGRFLQYVEGEFPDSPDLAAERCMTVGELLDALEGFNSDIEVHTTPGWITGVVSDRKQPHLLTLVREVR